MPILRYFISFTPAAGRRGLALAALSILSTQCQPATPAGQATARHPSPDSLQLAAAVATPLPKFDVESPILRQLALLPPAERNAAAEPMRQYQQLTRRFWRAQYSTDYLVKETQTGHPNLPVFAQQLATTQSHWHVLLKTFPQAVSMPPTMAQHLAAMQQAAQHQQVAISALQADCAAQRPPRLDAAGLANQQQVQQLLAPLERAPGPITVHLK